MEDSHYKDCTDERLKMVSSRWMAFPHVTTLIGNCLELPNYRYKWNHLWSFYTTCCVVKLQMETPPIQYISCFVSSWTTEPRGSACPMPHAVLPYFDRSKCVNLFMPYAPFLFDRFHSNLVTLRKENEISSIGNEEKNINIVLH